MTNFVYVPDWLFLTVRIFALIFVIFAIYNAVKSAYLHLGTANTVCTVLICLISSQFFVDVSVLIESRNFENRVTFTAKILGNIPCFVVIIFAFVLMALNIFMFLKLKHRRKNAITSETVKDTIDGMEDGVCFFAESGETSLVNIQMNKISSELFGTEIMNGQIFLKDILSGNYKSGVLLKTEPSIFIETSDKKVWDMRFDKHFVQNMPIYSVTAYEITEQSRLYREIKKRNSILSEMNQHLKEYNKAIKQVVADKETLAVKIRVHDNLGRVLLAARSVLSNPENEERKNELLNMWDEAILVMKNESKPTPQKDTLELLLQAAKSVQVEIEFDGEIPKESQTRNLIIAAAHECLTNTVKHAKGDRIQIKIKDFELYTESRYFNNGIPPKEPIVESGGLLNLRKIVEQAGGTMKIEITPKFVLIINLPKVEDTVWKK